MAESNKPSQNEMVECEVCLKEIPKAEAKSEEATDYVVHFCGLDCYSKWKKKLIIMKPDPSFYDLWNEETAQIDFIPYSVLPQNQLFIVTSISALDRQPSREGQ